MTERTEVTFVSGGVECAAYLYRPVPADGSLPCVVMAHGFTGTRNLGLPAYAERFAAAGMAVLVFDYAYFGASGGSRVSSLTLATSWMTTGPRSPSPAPSLASTPAGSRCGGPPSAEAM